MPLLRSRGRNSRPCVMSIPEVIQMPRPKPPSLDDFLNPSYVPPPSLRKKPKKAKRNPLLLKRYNPPIHFEDCTTPDAIVLFWHVYTCKCGETYEAPAFHGNPQFIRLRKDKPLRYPQEWEYRPLLDDYQHPELPRIMETKHLSVSRCVACQHHRPAPSINAILSTRERAIKAFYDKLLPHEVTTQ